MTTFTSSLPDQLLQKLSEAAQRLNIPKNKLIEKALEIYLDQLTRAEYVKSYSQAGQDESIAEIVEAGMNEYMAQLNEEGEAR
ncbi:ribbon-helix-helix domain-containing protein [Owenweeksia hongkongensis]|uniref:ribbon-helix-helix domain-containing protein n=1 Tax=Owenweeksia hongkongensis TaxID=253245 RepID=UPI003A94AD16